jgi:ABC-type multidrug transport system permease subunit
MVTLAIEFYLHLSGHDNGLSVEGIIVGVPLCFLWVVVFLFICSVVMEYDEGVRVLLFLLLAMHSSHKKIN